MKSLWKVIKNLDFDSDPKEFTTKAQKKTKHSPLGITIADGEPVNVSQKIRYWGIIVFSSHKLYLFPSSQEEMRPIGQVMNYPELAMY